MTNTDPSYYRGSDDSHKDPERIEQQKHDLDKWKKAYGQLHGTWFEGVLKEGIPSGHWQIRQNKTCKVVYFDQSAPMEVQIDDKWVKADIQMGTGLQSARLVVYVDGKQVLENTPARVFLSKVV